MLPDRPRDPLLLSPPLLSLDLLPRPVLRFAHDDGSIEGGVDLDFDVLDRSNHAHEDLRTIELSRDGLDG